MSTWYLPDSPSRHSDRELAYASPQGSRPGEAGASHNEEGKLGADGRRRRFHDSTNDQGGLTSDGFLNENMRVGGPYLCSFPVESVFLKGRDPIFGQRGGGKVPLNMILKTLVRYEVDVTEIVPMGRRSKVNPEPCPVPTVLVVARRKVIDETWLMACREIRAGLVELGHDDMAVEILSWTNYEARKMFVVESTHEIVPVWTDVLNLIMDIIPINEVNMIGCYRRGRSNGAVENPPTVVILVALHSNRNWRETRESIVDILDRFQLPIIAVEILKGTLERTGDSYPGDLNPNDIKGPARIGGSLMSSEVKHSSTTFGGFIDLKCPQTGLWKMFGLTCYHCVVPPEEHRSKDMVKKYKILDAEGIPMMDETARQRLHLQCPSTGDIEHQKEKLKDKINYHVYETREFHEWTKLRADGKIETLPGNINYTACALLEEVENAQRFLAELENFQKRNNHQFGCVVAGSGFRQTYPAICHGTELPMDASMDWALIDIPEERLGENVTPTGYPLAGREIIGPLITNIHSRTSGHSKGRMNILHDIVIVNTTVDGKLSKIATREHGIVGHHWAWPFSKPGDEGAFVYAMDGTVMGMLFARCDATNVAYAMHIDDLLADVKKVTGALDVGVSEIC